MNAISTSVSLNAEFLGASVKLFSSLGIHNGFELSISIWWSYLLARFRNNVCLIQNVQALAAERNSMKSRKNELCNFYVCVSILRGARRGNVRICRALSYARTHRNCAVLLETSADQRRSFPFLLGQDAYDWLFQWHTFRTLLTVVSPTLLRSRSRLKRPHLAWNCFFNFVHVHRRMQCKESVLSCKYQPQLNKHLLCLPACDYGLVSSYQAVWAGSGQRALHPYTQKHQNSNV